jgi:hypothetical protein
MALQAGMISGFEEETFSPTIVIRSERFYLTGSKTTGLRTQQREPVKDGFARLIIKNPKEISNW